MIHGQQNVKNSESSNKLDYSENYVNLQGYLHHFQ